MNRDRVQSSNLYSVGYDAEDEILEIEFNDSSVYQYFGIPEYIYSNLMSASSKGSYHHSHIRGKYRYKKIR